MPPVVSRIQWDRDMDEAHTKYHQDEAAAKKCKMEYWKWFDAVQNANPQVNLGKYGCCRFLDPHLNDHGLNMVKRWFERAQGEIDGRESLLSVQDAYFPGQIPGHELAKNTAANSVKQAEWRMRIHGDAIKVQVAKAKAARAKEQNPTPNKNPSAGGGTDIKDHEGRKTVVSKPVRRKG